MPSSSSAGVRASELQPTGKGIRPSSRDLESDGRFSTLTMGYEQPEPVLLREFRRRLTRWLEQGGVSDQARHAILLAGHGPPQTGRACRLRAADHRLGACRTRRDLDRGDERGSLGRASATGI